MPTPTKGGIDVIGIAAPLVDLAFGLAGNAKVTVILTLLGKRTTSGASDTVTSTGSYTVTIPGVLYNRIEQDTGEAAAARESTLLLNASDLVAAGVPYGQRPRTNDKVSINGESWTVYGIDPVPTDTIWLLRIRR